MVTLSNLKNVLICWAIYLSLIIYYMGNLYKTCVDIELFT